MRGIAYVFEYRITKYNPANRIDGRYVVDDWTSFSDIGKRFDKTELTYEKYLEIETAYIECCIDLLSKARIRILSIEQAECYSEDVLLPASVSDISEIRHLIAACLREQCWFKLTGKDFFIHFGYDYYMYIGSMLPAATVEETAIRYGLFCELCPSPYNASEQ